MRKLITTALVAAAFLGGYYLGRAPGSPDILALAKQAYCQARDAGGKTTGAAHAVGKFRTVGSSNASMIETVEKFFRLDSASPSGDQRGNPAPTVRKRTCPTRR